MQFVPVARLTNMSACYGCMTHIAGGGSEGFRFVMHSPRGGARGLRERLLEAAAADVFEVVIVIPALLRRYQLYTRMKASVVLPPGPERIAALQATKIGDHGKH